MSNSMIRQNILYNMDTYRLFFKSMLNIVGKIIKTIGIAMGCQPGFSAGLGMRTHFTQNGVSQLC